MLVYKLGCVKTTMHGGLSGGEETFGPWPKLTFKRELAGELVPTKKGGRRWFLWLDYGVWSLETTLHGSGGGCGKWCHTFGKRAEILRLC